MDLSKCIKLIERDANKIGIVALNKITYSELVKKYIITVLEKDYIIGDIKDFCEEKINQDVLDALLSLATQESF